MSDGGKVALNHQRNVNVRQVDLLVLGSDSDNTFTGIPSYFCSTFPSCRNVFGFCKSEPIQKFSGGRGLFSELIISSAALN